MTIPANRTAAELYAHRVDAALAQRARLRGPQPRSDLFAGLPEDSPLLTTDPRRPLEPNLEILASYISPDDVIVDAGGGAGRISLPLALRCREVINVEPSGAMAAAFAANVRRAAITNARVVPGDWLTTEPPTGTVALVNHVTYLTREIVPFLEKLGRAGRRRVLMTVNSPPPPSRHQVLFQLVHGGAAQSVRRLDSHFGAVVPMCHAHHTDRDIGFAIRRPCGRGHPPNDLGASLDRPIPVA